MFFFFKPRWHGIIETSNLPAGDLTILNTLPLKITISYNFCIFRRWTDYRIQAIQWGRNDMDFGGRPSHRWMMPRNWEIMQEYHIYIYLQTVYMYIWLYIYDCIYIYMIIYIYIDDYIYMIIYIYICDYNIIHIQIMFQICEIICQDR